jgi:hypothetical protein
LRQISSHMAGGLIALCALVVIGAVVSAASLDAAALPALVQTAPLWFVVVLGLRGGTYARWAALPMLLFWIAAAGLVVADQLGVTHLADTAFPLMGWQGALVVGAAGVTGVAACCAPTGRTSPLTALTLALACGAVQIGAFYFGMQSPF